MDLIFFALFIILVIFILFTLIESSYSSENNVLVPLIKKWRITFGIILIILAVLSIPLYLITGFGLSEVIKGPAVDTVIQLIFYGYPILYVISIILSSMLLRFHHLKAAFWCTLLPGINLIALGTAWGVMILHGVGIIK